MLPTAVNQDVVADLEALIRRGLMAVCNESLPRGCIIVRDLKYAKFLANLAECPEGFHEYYLNDEMANFTDIKRSVAGKLGANINDSNLAGYTERKLSFPPIEKRIGALAEANMTQRAEYRDLAEEVHADFRIIFLAKHFADQKNLGAALYRIYRAGGWPCGWHGVYPDGNIIVYWPHSQEPRFEGE